MSVLMTMRISGDPAAVEASDQDMMKTIVARAEQHGVISHHFYGHDNEVLVVDEWPDEASFQAFSDASPEIAELMASAGVTTQPKVEFWHLLNTKDGVGP